MSAFSTQTPNLAVDAAAAWAVRLSESELSADQQAAFDRWLDADPRHGELLEEIMGAWRSVDRYANAEAMTALREQALASGRRAMRRRKQTFPTREIIGGLIAATVLAAVAGGFLWARLTPQTYETGLGERRVVALKDGSKLSLDAETVVKVRYAGDRRRLWLERGRAKFDVAKDALRPFSVSAADKMVVATGTAFSVELVNAQVRVVLYEGRVAVLKQEVQPGKSTTFAPVEVGATPAERLLTPGRELILPDRSPAQLTAQTAVFEPADLERSLSWEGGLLVFNDEPLDIVVQRMNRYADAPLSVGNAATGRLRISGVFRAGDTESLVQGLSLGFGVQARTSRDGVALYAGASRARAG